MVSNSGEKREMIEENTNEANNKKSRLEEIEEVEFTIAELKAEIKKTRPKQRRYLYAIVAILICIAVGIYLTVVHSKEIFLSSPKSITPDLSSNGAFFLFFLFCLGGIIGILIVFVAIYQVVDCQTEITSMKSLIDIWQTKKTIISQFAKVTDNPTYFGSLVELNVLNLASYYELVKTHTEKSYGTTIRICLFGFFLIVAGLVLGFVDYANALLISITATASGILTEIISGVFFYLYNRTIQQMKEYHNSLLTVQNILLSFKLIEDTKDENEKAKIVGEMVAHLMNNQSSPIKITKQTPVSSRPD
jgi:tetrahydromethanopterin S-methyltransferase subunit G